jgi:rare lipoprotein A (peptidoglycan hydrolase)
VDGTRGRHGSALLATLLTVAVTAAFAVVPLRPATSALAAPPASAEGTRQPVPLPASPPPTGLDEATKRATDLQQEMDDLEAERIALDARIKQTDARIYGQSLLVERTRAERQAAQSNFDERVVGLYRAGAVSPLQILLSARSFSEAFNSTFFIYTMIERDQASLEVATKLSAETAYQAKVLDDLRTQDVALRQAADQRLTTLRTALGEQQGIVAGLTAQQRAYVTEKARFGAGQRAAWKASSYLGGPVPRVTAVVEPYTDRSYLVDAGEPVRYVTTGIISTELCSWYGNAENGTGTASGRAYNQNELTCATVMKDPADPSGRRLLPFGTRLALTRGERRVIVAVTDRGPYVGTRTVDLSRAAATALGFDGVEPVVVEIVAPK